MRGSLRGGVCASSSCGIRCSGGNFGTEVSRKLKFCSVPSKVAPNTSSTGRSTSVVLGRAPWLGSVSSSHSSSFRRSSTEPSGSVAPALSSGWPKTTSPTSSDGLKIFSSPVRYKKFSILVMGTNCNELGGGRRRLESDATDDGLSGFPKEQQTQSGDGIMI